MSANERNSITDPATAADRGYHAPLYPGSANLHTALTRGQELLIAPVTGTGVTGMAFPGVAIGEGPTGGDNGQLRWKNTDITAIRIRRVFVTAPDGAFIMFRFRVGASDLQTGFIHSGTVQGNQVPLDLGEGFLALPGDTVTVEAFAQVAAPAPFTVRMVWSAIREVNYKREPVPTDPGAEGRLLRKLHEAIESADSRESLAILNEEQLTRRWWSFVNGAGIAGGVGTDRSVFGFGAVDLTVATGPVVTGFQNQQTGPFLLENLWLFDDGADPNADGFQVSQVQLSNTNYVSDGGGPIRSDVLRAGSFGTAALGRLAIPYPLAVPIWITSNRPLRVTLDVATGLTPTRVWMTYTGTLFGNPQK